jgi:predicted nucleic acid-binding protein
MNVLIDTNVVLDVLLKREPFREISSEILFMSENGIISGFVSASAITDIFYLVNKEHKDSEKSHEAIGKLCETVKIAGVDEKIIKNALALKWRDFEDCVQYSAATDSQADYIITRDASGFASGVIPPISPLDFIISPNDDGEDEDSE